MYLICTLLYVILMLPRNKNLNYNYFVYLLALCFSLMNQNSLEVEGSYSYDTYKAAVVGYYPFLLPQIDRTLDLNSERYVDMMKEAHKQNVSFMVFPENGLTGKSFGNITGRSFYSKVAITLFKPSKLYHEKMCFYLHSNKYPMWFAQIGCAALTYNMTVVINIYEKVKCEFLCCKHSDDEVLYFSTNVVFNNESRIISLYRKTFAFDEPELNITIENPPFFISHFGVLFTQLIGSEWLETPPEQFLVDPDVSNVVLSTSTDAAMPLLTSRNEHASWSYNSGLNLLVAGFNSSVATGIYENKCGITEAFRPEPPNSVIIIAEVSVNKNISCEIMKKRHYKVDVVICGKFMECRTPENVPTELDQHESGLILLQILTHSYHQIIGEDPSYRKMIRREGLHTALFSKNVTCEFSIKVKFSEYTETIMKKNSQDKYYRYRIFLIENYEVISSGKLLYLRVCAVIRCTNDSVISCGQSYSAKDKVLKPMSLEAINLKLTPISNRPYVFSPLISTDSFSIIQPNNNMTIDLHDDTIYFGNNHLYPGIVDLKIFGIYGRTYISIDDVEDPEFSSETIVREFRAMKPFCKDAVNVNESVQILITFALVIYVIDYYILRKCR